MGKEKTEREKKSSALSSLQTNEIKMYKNDIQQDLDVYNYTASYTTNTQLYCCSLDWTGNHFCTHKEKKTESIRTTKWGQLGPQKLPRMKRKEMNF